MADEPNLFGQPTTTQFSLFGPGENRMTPPRPSTRPDPDEIRRKLNRIVEKARNADEMPWSDHDVGMWQTVFPNMASWLPDDEAAQLNLAFEREIERLSGAVETR